MPGLEFGSSCNQNTHMFDVFGLESIGSAKHDGISYIEKHMSSKSGMVMIFVAFLVCMVKTVCFARVGNEGFQI